MLRLTNHNHNYALYAAITAFVALVLRFYKIDFQSLWLDELYTMRECDPAISWKETIDQVIANEHKSPLHFLLEKLMFVCFGYTDVAARALSAIAGAASVYAMFLLGREFHTARTGFIVSVLTCLNYFNMYYSQEARGYIFLFLFTVMALTYFIKLYRQPRLSTALCYGSFALLALHFHPFGILTVAANGCMILLYLLTGNSKEKKTDLFKFFALACVLIVVGLLPLAAGLTHTAGVTSMWIPMPPPRFFIDYFFEFFWANDKLKILLALLCASFLVFAILAFKREEKSDTGPGFRLLFLGLSLLVIFLIPYLYSLYRVPVMVIRYTIVALPLILLIIAMGISQLPRTLVRSAVLLVFIFFSASRLSDYYKTPVKAQFKQVAQFVKENSPQPYPVINQNVAWMLQYYFETLKIPSPLINGNRQAILEEVLNGRRHYPEFWLVGAHGEPKLDSIQQITLLEKYTLNKSADLVDAWAQLYVARDSSQVH